MSGQGEPAPGATPGATAGALTLAADPAFAQWAPELQGAFKNKGWDQKTPAEAAAEAMKSYNEAERHIGIPKDQILRMPKGPDDAEGWKALRTRLGAPEAADKYDFSEIKFADGTELDEGFTSAMRNALFARGTPTEDAKGIVKDVVSFLEGAETASSAEQTAALTADKQKLVTSWGPNKEANEFIVRQAVMKLGLDEGVVNALEKASGYEPTMQALLKIGQMMGEDKFVTNRESPTKGVLTREQAMARKQQLRADSDFVSRFNADNYQAIEEMNALDRIIAGV